MYSILVTCFDWPLLYRGGNLPCFKHKQGMLSVVHSLYEYLSFRNLVVVHDVPTPFRRYRTPKSVACEALVTRCAGVAAVAQALTVSELPLDNPVMVVPGYCHINHEIPVSATSAVYCSASGDFPLNPGTLIDGDRLERLSYMPSPSGWSGAFLLQPSEISSLFRVRHKEMDMVEFFNSQPDKFAVRPITATYKG